MPICFLCSGIIFIFIIFNIFNVKLFGSKLNFWLFFLYLSFQIFSFFLKDAVYFNISVVYYVPIIFAVLFMLTNIKHLNFIKCLTISVLTATMLIAIGFIDNSFVEFIENNIFAVCFISSLFLFMFSSGVVENFVSVILTYVVFVLGLIFKQNLTYLTNVTILNCVMLSVLICLFLFEIKNLITYSLGVKNAKIKKV